MTMLHLKTSRSNCPTALAHPPQQWIFWQNLSGMSLKANSRACICVHMSLHVPRSSKLEGGAPQPLHNRRCLGWTMCTDFHWRLCGDVFEFVRSNKAVSVGLHAWLCKTTALVQGRWTVSRNSVVRFPTLSSVWVCENCSWCCSSVSVAHSRHGVEVSSVFEPPEALSEPVLHAYWWWWCTRVQMPWDILTEAWLLVCVQKWRCLFSACF